MRLDVTLYWETLESAFEIFSLPPSVQAYSARWLSPVQEVGS